MEDNHDDNNISESASIHSLSLSERDYAPNVESEQEPDDFPPSENENDENQDVKEEEKELVKKPKKEEDERGTLFHRFPGQEDSPVGRVASAMPQKIDSEEGESHSSSISDDGDSLGMANRRRKVKNSIKQTEQDIIKERLDALNRQLMTEQERRMKKPSEFGRRLSIATKLELVTIKGLVHSILNRPEDYSSDQRPHTTGASGLTDLKARVAQKKNDELAANRTRFLKLRTHKSFHKSKKKAPPLPITPPKPNPLRKAEDQALNSEVVFEKLLVIKKEDIHSNPTDLKRLIHTSQGYYPPSRKGPFYEEPFKAGMINARFYKLLKKIDATIAKIENEETLSPENEEAKRYIHREFKELISSGGFYPTISYTPKTVVAFEKERKQLNDVNYGSPFGRRIPSTAPAGSISNHRHFDRIPTIEKLSVFSQPLPFHSKIIPKYNAKGVKPVLAYSSNRNKEPLPSNDSKSAGKKNIVLIVGPNGTKQSNIATPITLPSLHKNKTNNPIQSIITGMENHGKLKQAKFRIAFHRNYKEEFSLTNLSLISKKNENENQKEAPLGMLPVMNTITVRKPDRTPTKKELIGKTIKI